MREEREERVGGGDFRAGRAHPQRPGICHPRRSSCRSQHAGGRPAPADIVNTHLN